MKTSPEFQKDFANAQERNCDRDGGRKANAGCNRRRRGSLIYPAPVHHRRKTQSARADAQFAETELLHHRLVNRGAGQNHIGAFFWQADDLLALGQRQAPQMFARASARVRG